MASALLPFLSRVGWASRPAADFNPPNQIRKIFFRIPLESRKSAELGPANLNRSTNPIERRRQQSRDLLRIPLLNIAPMHHVHRLPILEQRNRRRRRRIRRKNRPQMRHRSLVSTRKHGGRLVRLHRMLQSQADRRPRPSCRASANRIDHHQHRAASRREQSIDISGRARFFNAVTGKIGTHGSEKMFRVRHASILPNRPK
jgi:hypothetical protein